MTLATGSSPQGSEFYDTEAITYVGDGTFVLGEERYRQVNLFTYRPGSTLQRSDVQTVKLATTIGNTGLEGISYDPQTSTPGKPGFVAVKELDPKGIFQTDVDFGAGTATNGSPTTDEATNLFDPSLVATDDFSDVFALSNLPNLTGPDSDNLLIISQQSGKIVNVSRSGQVESTLTIADAAAPLSVPDETHEGVTMDRDGTIYTVNENGGGDSSHPQLWVYAPTAAPSPRIAVTEVAPWGGNASYGADWFELTNTGSADIDLTGWMMDDGSKSFSASVALRGITTLAAGTSAVFLEDTGGLDDGALTAAFSQAWFGSPTPPANLSIGFYGGSGVGLSANGDGVNIFDASGGYRTGVAFGAATDNVTFDNSARLGSTAGPVPISTLAVDGVNKAFVAPSGELGSPAGLTPVTTPPPSGGSVVITEVAPWASGNSPYAADWFELTNTGSTSVNLTGWTMDDGSNLAANSVPLVGVASLPPGESAVFLEDTGGDDATIRAGFAQAWFSLNALPAGFSLGFYGGSGVGLSTGGDAVNIFDVAGNRVTGVAFGASPTTAPLATFDNTSGAGSTSLPLPVISALSVAGTNGAFLAADGQEIGSPAGAGPSDRTPPTIVAAATPLPNAYGYNSSSVTVSYTCTDAGVGVDDAASSLGDDVLTVSGTATGICIDLAGNSASASYTAQIDTVGPSVVFAGNAGSYGILDTVSITCTAGDALSGLASSTCPAAHGPGWSFGAGAHTLSAQASDKAGNVSSASATFTVTVAAGDLSRLTTQFVQSSTRFQASNPLVKYLVSAIVGLSSQAVLDSAAAAHRPAAKAALLRAYAGWVDGLAASRWLTPSQAATLTSLSAAM